MVTQSTSPSPLPLTACCASLNAAWPKVRRLWPLQVLLAMPSVVLGALAGRWAAVVLALAAATAGLAWSWRVSLLTVDAQITQQKSDKLKQPSRQLHAAALGLAVLWAPATLGIYPHLPPEGAALHLMLFAVALSLAQVELALLPRVAALVAVAFGAPLAMLFTLHAAWPAAPGLALGAAGVLAAAAAGAWLGVHQRHAWRDGAQRTLDSDQAHAAAAAASASQADAAQHAGARQLAVVSHELRTPLSGLLGTLALLDRTPLPQTQRHLLKLARGAGEGLLAVLNDMQDFCQAEVNRLVLRPQPTALRALAESALGVFEASAKAKGLALQLHVVGPVPDAVLVDGPRLRQVLLNLLGNAVKFTDQGEVRLEISATPQSGPQSALESGQQSCPTTRICWTVHDTGIGIAVAAREGLFEPFHQLPAGAALGRGGTGLGLAISRHLVRAMGSEIVVRSLPGEGSHFSFDLTLPHAEPPSAPEALDSTPTTAAPEAAAVWPRLHGTVLLAESNDASRMRCTELLLSFGLVVRAVGSQVRALAALQEAPPDLLLVDVKLPGLNLPRLLAQWRQAKGVDDATTLPAITLRDEEDHTPLARGGSAANPMAGLATWLVRPWSPEQLHALLADWLAQSCAPDQGLPLGRPSASVDRSAGTRNN